MVRKRWTDTLSTHPLPGPHCNAHGSGAAVFSCAEALQQAQATSLRENPLLGREYWKSLTGFQCWTIQTHENEGFMNENVPQAIACVSGAAGLGDGSSAKVPACELWAAHNAGDVTCLKIPFVVIRKAKGSNKRHTLNFRIVEILWPNGFSWIGRHLAPLQSQALLLGMVDIKPGGLH